MHTYQQVCSIAVNNVHPFYYTVNCTCDVTVNTEIHNTLLIVCTGPSTAPCVCNDTDCEVCDYHKDTTIKSHCCSYKRICVSINH